jgi:hypothetical protein
LVSLYYSSSQLILLVIIFIWFQNIGQEGTRIEGTFRPGKLLLQKSSSWNVTKRYTVDRLSRAYGKNDNIVSS